MKYITSKEMKRVDDIAMKQFGIKIEQMMELAGKNLAKFVSRLKPKSVVVLYGKGNNGGGGLVAARHLVIKGVKVSIMGVSKSVNKNVKNQLAILRKMRINPSSKFKRVDVIIDALIGYNLRGAPRKNFAKLIEKANKSKAKIVSLDIPSGIDSTTGKRYEPHIEADYTLTLALPKIGLKKANIKNVYLANIGIPLEVYRRMGIKMRKVFKEEDIIKLR